MRAALRWAAAATTTLAAGLASGGCIQCYRYKSSEVAPAFKDAPSPETARAGPPPPDERTYAAAGTDYRVRFPAGWTFGDVDEVVTDAKGSAWPRRRLEAREGGGVADTRATLTAVVRDLYLDGEDAVRRDLEAWLAELTKTHADLGVPAARGMPPDAPAGVIFALQGVDTAGKRWAYDRAYVYAVATARAYILTIRVPAERRKGFSGQIDLLLQGLVLLDPPPGVPSDSSGCLREGAGLVVEGRIARAAHCWALLLDAGVGDASPLRYALGDALERMGLSAEALAQYRRAAEETKKLGEVATARLAEGLLLRRLGRVEEAVAAYEKGLAASPDDRRLLLNLGLAHPLAADPGKAVTLYERVLAGAPDDVEALENAAAALVDAGRLTEAKARLETAIGLRRTRRAAASATPGDAAAAAAEEARWLARDEEALRKVVERLKR